MRYYASAKKARSAHITQLTKLYNELERQMVSEENVERVKQLYVKLCAKYDLFESAHVHCAKLCDDTENSETLETNYSSHQQNFAEFKERYSEWIQHLNECTEEKQSVISSASSARTSREVRSAKAKRLLAEHKLRTLRKKQKLDRLENKLESERRELENERQLLEQESEIEEARIEESVWEEDDTAGSKPERPVVSSVSSSMCASDRREPTPDRLRDRDDLGIRNEYLGVEYPAVNRTADDGTRDTRDRNSDYPDGMWTTSGGARDDDGADKDYPDGMRTISGGARDDDGADKDYPDGMRTTSGGARDDDGADKDYPDGMRTTSGGARDVSMATGGRSSNTVVTSQSGPYGKADTLSSNSGGNMDAAFHRLASTLQEGFNLPKPELLTFNGSAIDYCKFIKNFETNIESKISDDRLRLSYLIQYCIGEARSCIEDCVLLDSVEGYRRARNILQNRYGIPHVIARSFIDRLVYGPPVKGSDTNGLSQLALEMQKCEITLSQLGFISDVDNSETLRRIVKRLPMHLRVRWVDVAHSILESGREPRFSDLARFVDVKARIASSMYGIDLVKETRVSNNDSRSVTTSNRVDGSKVKVTTLSLQGQSAVPNLENKCCCCCSSGSCRELAQCNKFKNMTLGDRTKLVRKFRLCYNCLKGNHFSVKCRKSSACSVSDCNLKHHTLLHSWAGNTGEHTATQSSVNCASTDGPQVKTCLGIIPVVVKGENGSSCKTYALLDDGADKTLCDERLLKRIQVNSKPVSFKISTLSSTGTLNYGHEVDLQVESVHGDGQVNLQRVWSVKKLPVSTRSAATNMDVKRFPYLANLEIPQIDTGDVMLLIGTDSPDTHIPLEVRSGGSREPYAVKTMLGWTVRGPVHNICESNSVNVNFHRSSDESLQQQLERMWNTDFDDTARRERMSYSVEDKRALNTMETSITHANGHYKLGLPWRTDNCTLPNNMTVANARLEQLKRKLSRDPKMRQMYTTTMNDYIQKGYAREVIEPVGTSQCIWYLPHHPVTNRGVSATLT